MKQYLHFHIGYRMIGWTQKIFRDLKKITGSQKIGIMQNRVRTQELGSVEYLLAIVIKKIQRASSTQIQMKINQSDLRA